MAFNGAATATYKTHCTAGEVVYEHTYFRSQRQRQGHAGHDRSEKYNITHVESGVIFRETLKAHTLGLKAKEYIDRGNLVPDGITIP